MSRTQGWRRQAAELAALALFAAGVLYADAAVKEIHGTAGLYAALAREIADTGDWFGIFRGPDAYLLKPPLMIWLTAGVVELLGPGSFSGTFAVRACGLAVVALTCYIGRRMYGHAAGWFAALVLVTNSTFHQFSTALRMDPLLTAGSLLAIAGYLRGGRAGAWAFHAGIVVGILAKGPQAAALLLLLPVHAGIAGRLPAGGRHWGLAASLLLAPLAWYGWLTYEHGTRWVSELAADTVRDAPGSLAVQLASAWHEYAVRPFHRYWPWLPFMLAGLAAAVWRGAHPATAPGTRADSVLLVLWVVLVVAGSSLKPEHDIRYLYPALPAAAILAGWMLARLAHETVPRWVSVPFGALGIALLVLATMPGRVFDDTRAANAEIVRRLDATLAPGEPVLTLGFHVNNRPGPRRQDTHVDWVYYYYGRPARVVEPELVTQAELRSVPLLLVARYGRRREVLERLDLEPLVEGEEMLLAVSRARAGGPPVTPR